ncbi:hypothetical protein [Candidatus Nitrosotenuis sp. DW1]|uniref:hypothetical protein n=1 Tax=Candidatus Nitrosotenuis sp. DW1 TaxID=2259672 RepID=UPI0015CA8AF2|nr:hypothetical protein [Candidatus Nitrosotenuis sp. DW1]QLH09212.1 hypothetical protein DSQ19_06795 [Candidatus Nitrosotenuis sp. DW1]
MRFGKPITIIGVILIFFGVIFQFQGRGQLGPESSFMYYNKDWISNGMIIIASGIIIGGIGMFLSRR